MMALCGRRLVERVVLGCTDLLLAIALLGSENRVRGKGRVKPTEIRIPAEEKQARQRIMPVRARGRVAATSSSRGVGEEAVSLAYDPHRKRRARRPTCCCWP